MNNLPLPEDPAMSSRPDSPVTEPPFITRDRYEAFIAIARNRITTRQFDPSYVVPRAHYEMILEAARHAPSGANTWVTWG